MFKKYHVLVDFGKHGYNKDAVTIWEIIKTIRSVIPSGGKVSVTKHYDNF